MSHLSKLATFIAGLACLIASSAQARSFALTISPANPRPLESVQLLVSLRIIEWISSRPCVSMAGNKITVAAEVGSGIDVGLPLMSNLPIGLGQLPAGTYSVEFINSFGNVSESPSTTQFTVANPADRIADYPGHNYSDLWWNPDESGWGMSIHVKNDNFFAAWFVYDQGGRAQWYTLQAGSWSTKSASELRSITYSYTGKVVKTSGPNFGGIGPLSTGIAVAEVGTATIEFLGYGVANFSGTVEGRAFSKRIVRQAF